MIRFILYLSCAALLLCTSPLSAAPKPDDGKGRPATSNGHPAGGPGGPTRTTTARTTVRYQHPPAPQQAQVRYQPVPTRVAPDQFHPAATRPVRVSVPQITRNVTIRNPQIYRDINNYHINQYHTTVNIGFASRPGSDRGYWGNGWYHGYWHDYWQRQNWTNWGGHYGFWFALDGINVFVYEYSPGVCWYWDGSEYAPWYNPPYTPYDCPY